MAIASLGCSIESTSRFNGASQGAGTGSRISVSCSGASSDFSSDVSEFVGVSIMRSGIAIARFSVRTPPWFPPPKPGVTILVPYAYMRSHTWAKNAMAMHLVSDLVCPHLVHEATSNEMATIASSMPSTIAHTRPRLMSPMAAKVAGKSSVIMS